jgi:hypothetical protein
MTINLIGDAVYNNFLIDTEGRPFCGDLRVEDNTMTPVVMMIGLCDKYDVDQLDVESLLCIEREEYEFKLDVFKQCIDQGQRNKLFGILTNDSAVKRFYIKYQLCMNYIKHSKSSYVSLYELSKKYRK